MTTAASSASAACLGPDDVLTGELPEDVSMAPVIEGVQVAHERTVYDGPEGFYAVWACDAGRFPRRKDRRGSFMYLLSGSGRIVDQDGTSHELEADSVLVLPYGWVGTWDIRSTVRKVYLHTNPAPPLPDDVVPSVFAPAAAVLPAGGGGVLTVFDGPDGRAQIHTVEAGTRELPAVDAGRFLFVTGGTGTLHADDGAHLVPLSRGASIALPTGWSGRLRVDDPLRLFEVVTQPIRTPTPTPTADRTRP